MSDTNIGLGMVPCRKGCRCPDCQIETLERALTRQNNAVAALNEDCKEAERQLAAAKAKLSDAEAELERRQAKIMSAKAECEAHEAVRDACFEALPECQVWGDVPGHIKELKEECEALRRDAERYRWLRNSPNAYPLFFIAQRDPQNIVVQFKGELADLNIDAMREGNAERNEPQREGHK